MSGKALDSPLKAVLKIIFSMQGTHQSLLLVSLSAASPGLSPFVHKTCRELDTFCFRTCTDIAQDAGCCANPE